MDNANRKIGAIILWGLGVAFFLLSMWPASFTAAVMLDSSRTPLDIWIVGVALFVVPPLGLVFCAWRLLCLFRDGSYNSN